MSMGNAEKLTRDLIAVWRRVNEDAWAERWKELRRNDTALAFASLALDGLERIAAALEEEMRGSECGIRSKAAFPNPSPSENPNAGRHGQFRLF